MGFPRQEYWSGLPFPLPDDLPDMEKMLGMQDQTHSPSISYLAGRFFFFLSFLFIFYFFAGGSGHSSPACRGAEPRGQADSLPMNHLGKHKCMYVYIYIYIYI